MLQGKAGRLVEGLAMMICGIAFAGIVLGIVLLVLTGNRPSGRDFVSYWTAGHQILHHQDPYDGATILATERSVGFPPDAQSLIMRNAPWALCLVMPLGLLGLQSGALFWTLLLVACLLISAHLLWIMHGRPKGKIHLLGYSFGPALACILGGQTGVFPLLGLVLFLRFHRQRPFVAGLSLWLCALKPHLLLPSGTVLLVWIVLSRSYRILAGLGVALAVSSLIASILDPGVWVQYGQMMRTAGIEREFIPCLGVVLRLAVRKQAMWLEYIPAAAGCVWGLSYYWKHRDHWDWMEHGAILTLVSVVVAPYAWCTDQALLIPALLQGAYWATSRSLLIVLALAGAVLEIQMLMGLKLHSAWLLWTTPFWLAWYLYVTTRACGVETHGIIPQGDVVYSSL
jgi:hypothetical protein